MFMCDCVGQRVNRSALLIELDHLVENAAVRGQEKIIGLEVFNGLVDRDVVEQDHAKEPGQHRERVEPCLANDLGDDAELAEVLANFPVEDLWGVGHKRAPKLAARGITTAAHLRDAPPQDILGTFGVTLARTQRELQGHSCIELAEMEPDRQQIVVSRSFGARVEDHEAVAQAVATFAVRACEKLRSRGLVASGVQVFANTDMFRPELKQHHPSRSTSLPAATADSRVILMVVRQLMTKMLKTGYGYKKAGITLLDLGRPEERQADLFAPPTVGNPALMATLDRINQKFGRGTAGLGATGWDAKPQWGMRQQSLSGCFTTAARDLPRATC